MIVSHEHRFIFLKTRKTAGTSVEIALSQHCGPEDIITPISPDDEVTRRQLGGRGPQHYELPLRMYSAKDVGKLVLRRHRARAYNHMLAREVRRLVGPTVWANYYKFSIERNPWSAAVSWYYWRTRKESARPGFREFILGGGLEPLRLNEHIYRVDGCVVADKIAFFENLDHDLDDVRKHLGLPALEVPLTKANTGRAGRRYQEMFDEELRAIVGRMFASQINGFGYRFE